MGKIAFFDIDGTLFLDGEIPASTIEAIFLLKKNGVIPVISTGRSVRDAITIAKQLDIEHLITFNGARVAIGEQEVFSSTIDPDDLNHVLDLTAKEGHPVVLHTAKDSLSRHHDHPTVQMIYEKWGLQDPLSWDGHIEEDVYQMNVFLEPEHDERYRAAYPMFFLYRWHPMAIDLQQGSIHKAVGVGKMLERLKMDPRDAIAFGDGGNDVEMLSYVGYGIAMGNGRPEAKAAANMVTDDIFSDGIWNALKKLEWI